MNETLKLIFDWLSTNWGWVIAVFCIFFEITPIKINPITSICRFIGNRLTKDLKNDVEKMNINLQDKYNELKLENESTRRAVDMQRIANIKAVVLDFANSCRNNERHSKEEFTYVLSENDVYEELIKKYNLINNVYREDFAYIKEVYHRCLHENDFLA